MLEEDFGKRQVSAPTVVLPVLSLHTSPRLLPSCEGLTKPAESLFCSQWARSDVWAGAVYMTYRDLQVSEKVMPACSASSFVSDSL